MVRNIGLAEIVAGVMMIALTAYVLTGGADFGGGLWDLLARGPRRDAQRALIAHTISPIWEANHVWLILVVVILFTAFPPVYATLSVVLHIPLTLMLVGIVARGSAFMFRSYGSPDDHAAQRRWSTVFAIASIVTPAVLGTMVGAITSGNVGRADRLMSVAPSVAHPTFSQIFIAPWLSPFPLLVGSMALALFAFLAAVYLTVQSHDEQLCEDFRARALVAAGFVFITAFFALGIAHLEAPEMSGDLLRASWAIPLQAAIAVSAITAIYALWVRRYGIARIAAASQTTLILWGWVLSQNPFAIPPYISLADAAAPKATLELLLWAIGAGAIILLPSLWFLYRTFARAGGAHVSTSER